MYGRQDIVRFGEVFAFGTPRHGAFTLKDLLMGDIGGVAQAGASVADTSLTNATNLELQQRADQFNAQQASAQRAWSGQQAQNQMNFNAAQAQMNRQFQTGERVAAQDYDTQMSNTQVQRRAQDIAAAGFNPLLAVGQLGGASSPTSSPQPGSTASAGLPSGASASAVTPPRMQGMLPGIVDTLNAQAQRNTQRAQADNLDAQAATARARLPYAAAQAAADVGRTNQEISSLIASANRDLSQYDINENTIPTLIQDRQFRAQLQEGLMQLQSLDIQAKRYGNAEGAARADVFNSPLGRYLVVAGLGHQAGGDVGAAAATALWQLYQNPLKPPMKRSQDVQISDPTSLSGGSPNFSLESSGIGAPTP